MYYGNGLILVSLFVTECITIIDNTCIIYDYNIIYKKHIHRAVIISCCYHSGNYNGFIIEPWFILSKVRGWHNIMDIIKII